MLLRQKFDDKPSPGINNQLLPLIDYHSDKAYPDSFWTSSTPEEQGMDESILLKGLDYIRDNKIKIYSLLVIRNNKVVFERYGCNALDNKQCTPYTLHYIHSCTKSIVSALIGIAIGQGHIKSINDPILQYFDDLKIERMSTEKESITIADVLTMRSGLEWGESDIEETDFMNAPIPVKYVLDQKMKYPAGEVFNYSSGHVHILTSLLHRVTGKTPLQYAEEVLLQPLGIVNTPWLADSEGTNYGCFGISLTARDISKFASLYLTDGVWEGQKIIPAKWISDSLEVHTQSNWTKENFGYLWWLPNETMAAIVGAWGQNTYVIRSHNMIVSFNAKMTFESLGNNLATFTQNYICNAILKYS